MIRSGNMYDMIIPYFQFQFEVLVKIYMHPIRIQKLLNMGYSIDELLRTRRRASALRKQTTREIRERAAAVKPEELREARWGKMRDWSCMWNAEWRKIYKTFKKNEMIYSFCYYL